MISQECSPIFKHCLGNKDSSTNLGLVKGGYLHYLDLKKCLQNLLWNCRANFEIILQKCSLGDPFQKVFAKFWSINKHGSGEWGATCTTYTHMKKFSKILLLWNCWSDFDLFYRNVLLVILFKNLSAKFWYINKHFSGEWGLLTRHGHEEILKNFLLKPMVRFWNNSTEVFLG